MNDEWKETLYAAIKRESERAFRLQIMDLSEPVYLWYKPSRVADYGPSAYGEIRACHLAPGDAWQLVSRISPALDHAQRFEFIRSRAWELPILPLDEREGVTCE